jgi:hypothetical protein
MRANPAQALGLQGFRQARRILRVHGKRGPQSPTNPEHWQPVLKSRPCLGRWYGSKDQTSQAGVAQNAHGSSTLLILLPDRRLKK